MNLIYKYAESGLKPAPVEINANTVFLRKDIESFTRKFEDDEEYTFWGYQEATLSIDDFNVYSNLLSTENAIKGENDHDNIIKIMAGQETGDTNQLTIMEAIADLYDIVAAMGTSTN